MMDRRIGRRIAALAVFAAAVGWASSSLAEGALALGMPENDPNRGFRWSIHVNTPDAGTVAMQDCHAAKNPKIAVAVNADGPVPVSAAGWAIEKDSESARRAAIAMCEGMRHGRGIPCILDGETALLCDGSAK
jgi:hypothetical protein